MIHCPSKFLNYFFKMEKKMKKLILTALICLFSISAYAKQEKSCFKTK